MSIEVRPYSSAIGAEILGVDLSEPLDNATWSTISEAWDKYMVLFFRDQHITPQQHIDFSRRFGILEEYPFVKGIEGYPELIDIVKMPDEVKNFGHGWHVDMSFREQPPTGAVLYAMEVPPFGGDTMFCNMELAYETLSDGMKKFVHTFRGVHDSLDPAGHSEKFKGMSLQKKADLKWEHRSHPLVRTHPVSGRTSLFISPDYCWEIEGMSAEESRMMLDYLEKHATQHEFICRFRWAPNSIAMWDNRCTMHNALNDDLAARSGGQGFKRVMRRSTIAH